MKSLTTTTNATVATQTEKKYNVATIRAAGLEAKWSRNQKGAPIIVARIPSGKPTWFFFSSAIWKDAQREGIFAAFARHTLLGEIFSLPA